MGGMISLSVLSAFAVKGLSQFRSPDEALIIILILAVLTLFGFFSFGWNIKG